MSSTLYTITLAITVSLRKGEVFPPHAIKACGEGGGRAPRILNLCYCRGLQSLNGPHNFSGLFGEDKFFFCMMGIETPFLRHATRSLVTIPTELIRL